MTSVKKWARTHVVFLSLFLGTLIYIFIVVWQCHPWEVTDTGFSVHALDYSLGFASSILPGAIYNLLFSELTYPKLTLYLTVLYILFLLIVSILLEKIIHSVKKSYRPYGFLLFFFFLTGPVTISAYFSSIGFLEFYWFFFALFFFIFLENRYLRPMIVILCIVELLINDASILCIIPSFIILMLYKYSYIQNKWERNLLRIIIILSVFVSIIFYFYLVLHGPMNMVYSRDDFSQFMQSRGAYDFEYRAGILYRQNEEIDAARNFMIEHYSLYDPNAENTFSVQAFINILIGYYCTSIGPLGNHHYRGLITTFLVILPILALIIGYLCKNIKNRNNSFIKQFSFFSMVFLFFFTLLTSLFLAAGHVRWLSFAFLPLISSFLYIVYLDRENPLDYLKTKMSKIPSVGLLIYCFLYAFIVPGIFAK